MLLGTYRLSPHHDETLYRTIFRHYHIVSIFYSHIDSAILNQRSKRKKADGRFGRLGRNGSR